MTELCPRCGVDISRWSDHKVGCVWHGASPVTLRIIKEHEARCHGSRASAAERAVMARDAAALDRQGLYGKAGA